MLLGVLVYASADAEAPDGAALLRALQRPRTVRAAFVQIKEMRAFKTPMQARGRLLFARPDRLRWEYTGPYRMVFVAAGSRASIDHPDLGRKMKADLADDPSARVVVEALLFFSGADAEAVRRRYQVSLDAQTVVLRPRDERARAFIDRIEAGIDEKKGVLHTVRIVEADGDRTTLTFSDVRVDEALDEALLRP